MCRCSEAQQENEDRRIRLGGFRKELRLNI